MGAPKLYKGKQKSEIAAEAFEKLGKNASQEQVDRYFQRHYGLPHCEQSMYYNAKRMAQGQPSYTAQRKKGGPTQPPPQPQEKQEKTVPTTTTPKLHEEPAKAGPVSKKDAVLAVLNDMGIDTEASKVIAEVKKRYKLDVNNKRVWDIRSELKGQTANQQPRARVQAGVTPPIPAPVEEPAVQTAAIAEPTPQPAPVAEVLAPVVPAPRLAEIHEDGQNGEGDQTGLFSPPVDVVTPVALLEPEPPIPNDPLSNVKFLKGLVSGNGLTLDHVKKILGMADRVSLDGLKLAVTTLEELQLSK